MAVLRRSVEIGAPVEEVFAFHMNPENLVRVAPPGSRTEIVARTEGPLRVGSQVTVSTVQMGMTVTLEAMVIRLEENRMFEDRQIRGPFKSWRHIHRFEPTENGTRLTDKVEFELPGGLAGRALALNWVMRQLAEAFEHRQEATRRLLEGADTEAEA